jgi:hypothetical protein
LSRLRNVSSITGLLVVSAFRAAARRVLVEWPHFSRPCVACSGRARKRYPYHLIATALDRVSGRFVCVLRPSATVTARRQVAVQSSTTGGVPRGVTPYNQAIAGFACAYPQRRSAETVAHTKRQRRASAGDARVSSSVDGRSLSALLRRPRGPRSSLRSA